MKRLACACLLLSAVSAFPASAQNWDSSGNGSLSGSYNFRQVMWLGGFNSSNTLPEAIALYGSIVFDGLGSYTLTAHAADGAQKTITPVSGKGTYTIAASGYGYMSTPLQVVYPKFQGDEINILVSPSKVVVGNTTDNSSGYNDMFLAAQAPASTPSLLGTYSVVGIGIPALTLDLLHTRQYSFTMTGTSNTISTTALTGAIGFNTKAMTQGAVSGAKYSVSGGAAVVTFGGELTTANLNTTLMSGTKDFYFSPDGNLFFGGSPGDTDFIVGVRRTTGGAFNPQTLYFTGGFFQDNSQVSICDCAWLNSIYGGYGVLTSSGSVQILAHQRDNAVGPPAGSFTADSTYSELLTVGTTYTDFFYKYFFGPGNTYAIGLANPTSEFVGIDVLLQGPHYTAAPGSAPYIFPTGIVNAGSAIPFTAELAPGEFVSIFGANLATTTAADPAFPSSISGVQVLVNGTPAPVRYVSPGQINAVIPITLTAPIASIQVVNSLGASNVVTNYVGPTQPGIFNSATATPAITHGDNTLVTAAHPAVVGEELAVYLTGLGTLDAYDLAYLQASFDGTPATINYAGIEPGTSPALGALYQLNVTVPKGTVSGLNYLSIGGFFSSTDEALICITSCGATPVSKIKTARAKTSGSPGRPRFPASPTVFFPPRLGSPGQ